MTRPCQIIQHNPRGFSSKGKCRIFFSGTYGYVIIWAVPHWNYKQWAVAQGWPIQRREESLVYSDLWKESLDVKQLQRMNVVSGWGIRFTMRGLAGCCVTEHRCSGSGFRPWQHQHQQAGPRRDTVCNQGSTHIPVPLSSPPNAGVNEKEGITRRAMASSNLYSLFAANKTKTGALESVKLWMLGYQLTGLFPTRMPGQGFPSHVKSAASAFTAPQVQ